MSTYDHVESDIRYQMAIEAQEHSLFALLKPSIKMDGNQWCVLYGENLQEGIAGFGSSPNAAVQAFNTAWYEDIKPSELFPGTEDAPNNMDIGG